MVLRIVFSQFFIAKCFRKSLFNFFLGKREEEIGKFKFFCNSKTIDLKIVKKVKEFLCKSRLAHVNFI